MQCRHLQPILVLTKCSTTCHNVSMTNEPTGTRNVICQPANRHNNEYINLSSA